MSGICWRLWEGAMFCIFSGLMRSTIAVDGEIFIFLSAQLKGGNAINTHIKKPQSISHLPVIILEFLPISLLCVVFCCLFEKCSWVFHTSSSSMLAEFCLGRAWWWRRRDRRDGDRGSVQRAASWKSCEQALHRSAVKCFEKKTKTNIRKNQSKHSLRKSCKSGERAQEIKLHSNSPICARCVNVCLYLAVKLRDSRRLYVEVSATTTTFSRTPNITN